MLELTAPPLKTDFTTYYHDASTGGYALCIAEMAKKHDGLMVVMVPDASALQGLETEVRFFVEDEKSCPVFTLPDWETLPYDYFSPHQDIISERIETLYNLPRVNKGILLIPVSSALQKLPPRNYIESKSLAVEVKQTLDIQLLKARLAENGYNLVSKVMEHGEFAVRGSILDLFPSGTENPIRIEFFDDEIESLRYFDSESQMTQEKLTNIKLLPAREYPTDDTAISRFRQAFRTQFDSNIKESSLYRDVSKGIFPAGIEYYLPLFFTEMCSIFDYLPQKDTLIIGSSQLSQTISQFWTELTERYEQHRHDVTRPIVEPTDLFLTEELLFEAKKQFAQVQIATSEPANRHSQSLNIDNCPTVTVEHKLTEPLSALIDVVDRMDKILICAESQGRQEVIRELLLKSHLSSSPVSDWANYKKSTEKINLTTMPIRNGFLIDQQLIISESNLFGNQVLQRRHKTERVISPDQLIHSLAELKIDDPVVHVEQGVGRYKGLETIDAGGISTEFLTLEYMGGSKLYVPVQSLHQIHRYSGNNPELAPWHKLGSEAWGKAKRKAIEKARDSAAELLDIYAKRGAEIGFNHKVDQSDYQRFASEFPFELTQDQDIAIKAVVNDMSSKQPMDRLICGDVGFGKTEVAMRAAFISVQSSMQVAMLVPTTLLAQQHFHSFQDRFSAWPINVAVLSRFQTKKEQAEVLERLESGQIDLVIGTHRLISGKLKFKNLGLLLIDEEHRFGVRQKEILKAYRSKVDILTLTATPIPRTLNMSMSGIRDLSIIATPPAKRLAIKTFVRERNEPLIKEAIQREIRRGGQVYLLHNSVESIEKTANEIRELLPEIEVVVAHGQMRERQLEQVMKDFYHHRFHVLVCTTIIETGIDIPTANTIIMDRADKLGLAQLHQLRGRVGRSHHQAYAYLMTPSSRNMTKDAKKRLEAIGKLENLGAGFILATHDLEIRGAGELLGEEQSGHMQTIGFSLYMELLERAIEAIKEGKEPDLTDARSEMTEVNLGISALLPEDYVPDVAIRLSLYKRIAGAKNALELRALQVELIDRFGLLPNQAKNLFTNATLKNKLSGIGVVKLESGQQKFTIEFCAEPHINTTKLIGLIQSQPGKYNLVKGTLLQINQHADNIDERLAHIETLIETLTS